MTTPIVQTGGPGGHPALQIRIVLAVLLGRRYSTVTGSRHHLLGSPMGFHRDRAREVHQGGVDPRHGIDRVTTVTALLAVEAVAATAAVQGGHMNQGRSRRYQTRHRPAEVEIGAGAEGRTIGRCRRVRKRTGGDIKRKIPT